MVRRAWLAANMSAAASVGKLKSLETYLPSQNVGQPQQARSLDGGADAHGEGGDFL